MSIVFSKGHKVGRLTVIKFFESRNRLRWWKCKCACGNTAIVSAKSLKIGRTKSCGCLHHDVVSKMFVTHGLAWKIPEYNTWIQIRQRCTNHKLKCWNNYGGRGIKVCKRWLKFENFLKDMGRRPSKNHSIDRIDCNGNYTPSNCRWATDKEQGNNRRNNRLIKKDGVIMTASQWARILGLKPCLVSKRIFNGWTPLEAISTKKLCKKIKSSHQ